MPDLNDYHAFISTTSKSSSGGRKSSQSTPPGDDDNAGCLTALLAVAAIFFLVWILASALGRISFSAAHSVLSGAQAMAKAEIRAPTPKTPGRIIDLFPQ